MRSKLLIALTIMAILAGWSLNVRSLIPNDADGDGVPDSVDACPTVDASMFDRNGDGCIDPDAGARHIEYWGVEDDTLTYFINNQGSPDVTNGSDFTALQNAMNAWPAIGGTELTANYGGTTTQQNANALDHVNLITFEDTEYPFSSLVLAVGVTTSFESDTLIAGRRYRPGQIYDADMIFNPSKTFKTTSGGVGTDIQSTATHEAGHLYGLSHSSIQSSTMFYVLPAGTAARSLEPDDDIAYFKAYADSIARAGANRIKGTVTNGSTSAAVAGAIVFVIDVATGDTTACEYTLPNGGYSIAGLPDGQYYVAIHPIDGSSAIGFIQPGNINALVEATAEPYFLPEYWDAAESATDDPAAKTPIAVSGGTTMTADLVTNVDATPPTVTSATPSPGTAGVAIDGAYVIRFSEGLDVSTVSHNLIFRRLPDSTRFGGNVAVLHDDSVLAFTPQHALDFNTQYELELESGLSDKSGNGLAAPYVLGVTTEPLPPVGIASLSPDKGVVGNTVVINGAGFDTTPFPTVMFDSTVATVSSASPGELVVTVPPGAATGPVTVTNSDMTVSNSKTFTVLSRAEVARGFESGTVNLGGVPRELTVTPDGHYAYVATNTGADAVVVNSSASGYLTTTGIPYGGGLDGIATTPTGQRVYAVSKAGRALVEIDSDPSSGLLFNTVLSTHPVSDAPLGIGVDRAGRRAYVPTDNDEIQIWDTDLGSPTYQQQIGVLSAPGNLVGKVAFTPAGDHLLALTANGDLLYYDVVADSLDATVSVGLDPQDVVVDPVGQRAYVSLAGGDVVVVALSPSPYFVQDIATGGSLRGLDVTPGAEFIYTVDRQLDKADIIDLDEERSTFRTVIADFDQDVNPIDVEVSPDGIYAFSVLQGDATHPARLAVNTIGSGPTLLNVYPKAAPVGAQIVLRGIDLGDQFTLNWVEFQGATQNSTSRQVVDPSTMIVTVPPGARTGAIRVARVSDLPPHTTSYSNELYFTVLDSTGNGAMRFSDSIGPAAGQMTAAVAVNPQGTLAFAGGEAGQVYTFDIDPSSPTFHQSLGTIGVQDGPIRDLAITADGKAMFVVTDSSTTTLHVAVVDVDRSSSLFLKSLPDVAITGLEVPTQIITSPDNQHALLYDQGRSTVFVIDATNVAGGRAPTVVNTIGVSVVTAMVFHPNGLRAYLGEVSPNVLATVDMDPINLTFGTIILNMAIPYSGTDDIVGYNKAPESMAFGKDGVTLYVDAVRITGPAERAVNRIGAPSPILPGTGPDSTYAIGWDLIPFGTTATPGYMEQLRVSPIGDRIVYAVDHSGIYNYIPPNPPAEIVNALGLFESLNRNDFAFTPDGTRVYMASTYYDSLRVFDFSAAQSLVKVSGDNQSGAENQTLPAPIRVQVTGGGQSLSGVALSFDVTEGGGGLIAGTTAGPLAHVVVATDAQGYADLDWRLGAAGTPQQVTVTAPGLAGSPQVFSATSVVDPATLPLELSQVLPLNGSTNISPTTAIQATFSRGVDPASVTSASLSLRLMATGATVPVAYGFTDSDRKVSLTPLSTLAYGEDYELDLSSAVLDTSGGNLTNPAASTFSTQPSPPPPTISAITPPSGLTGIDVVISGAGFDPTATNNTVLFNGTPATPKAGGSASLTVTVPHGAITGPVRVVAGADTSNARTFTVLVPSTSSVDEVLATIGTGAGSKSLAVSPDGALAYTVSTETDAVIPISVDSLTSSTAISVGDQPVAAAFHPDGNRLYVANFGSNSVSVIDTDPASANFNSVVGTIVVGANPIDVTVTPDERVITANAGSSDLSVIDGDPTSATYHTVLATIGVGAGSKSLAVSPDGARIYVGTNSGFVVLDASSYGVLATIGTGAGSKSLAVSPDGSLLYVLTTAGQVLVVDVSPGSPSENSVLATIGTGAGSKSLAVSPDGSLLYLVQENSNEVIVVSVTLEGGASAFQPVTAPQVKVVVAYEDTVSTGNDPSDVAFDPTGTGVAIITQAGEHNVIVLNASPFPSGPLAAEVEVRPQTLNLTSKGRYVTGIIELPLAYAPQEIVVSSVKLNGVIPAIPDKVSIADTDGDGIPELVTKFDREAFQNLLPIGEYVPVTITGHVRDRDFFGEDTIRTIRPTVTHPTSTTAVAPHANDYVGWTSPDGYTVDAVDVYYSLDDGQTWQTIAEGIADNGYVAWQTPDASSDQCRVMVVLHQNGDVLGIGMSEKFTLSMPLAVALQSFDASVEEGIAVMRWRTGLEIGAKGFQLERSQTKGGTYQRVTSDLIPARGGLEGASYEYRDPGIVPNRTYWYRLEEVTDTGPAMQFGPYKVEFRVSNSLAQNVPNPFNPTTTIKFSIARDENVRLVVYDVAGRRVRTLVDGPKRANFYKVAWDGRNDQGQHVASGVYFYRIEAGRFVKTRKMILLK